MRRITNTEKLLPHALLSAALVLATSASSQTNRKSTPPRPGRVSAAQLTVRLLGVDGKPVASEAVGVLLASPNQHEYSQIKTNTQGRLHIEIPDRLAASAATELRIQRVRLSSTLPWRRGQVRAFRGGYRGKLTTVRQHQPGADLQLQLPPLVLGGHTVDQKGQALAGVTVTIQQNFPGRGSGGGSGPDYYFHPQLRTDADGRFEFREFAEPRRWIDIAISSNTHTTLQPIRLAAGTSDARIRLTPTFQILGKVLGLPKNRRHRLNIVAELTTQSGRTQPLLAVFSPDGTFSIRGCLPGMYRIVIQHGNDRGTQQIIDKVVVARGKDCRDHRLLALDLSKIIREIHIQVINQQGQPVRCEVRHISEHKHGRSSRSFATDRHGKLTLIVPQAGGLLEIHHRGYQPLRLEQVRRDRVIKLKRSLRAEVSITNLPDLHHATAMLVLSGTTEQQALRNANETADFELHTYGRRTLTVTARPRSPSRPGRRRRNRPGNRPRGGHLLLHSSEFDALETHPAEQPIQLRIRLTDVAIQFLRDYDALLAELNKTK